MQYQDGVLSASARGRHMRDEDSDGQHGAVIDDFIRLAVPVQRRLSAAERAAVAAVAKTVPEWSLDEYRAEARSCLVLRGVDPDVRLAVFGTSGPAGTALNTVGVLRLDDGRHLLGSWRRHPLTPDYSPFLVLPDLEPPTVWDALIEILPCCGIGTPALGVAIDFVSVCAPAELAGAVRGAFLEVAAEPDVRMTGPAAHARGPLTPFGRE